MSETTDATACTLPPRSRSRIWQFSLRELLLLTVIAGLSLTVWRLASGTFEPTSFSTNFMVSRAIEDAELEVAGAGRVGTTELEQLVAGYRPDAEEIGIKHVCLCRLREESPPPATLLTALQSRLKSQLADAGCEIVDEGVSPTVAMPGFPNLGFFINYRQGQTRGLVNIDAVARGNELEIYVLIHEYRDR